MRFTADTLEELPTIIQTIPSNRNYTKEIALLKIQTENLRVWYLPKWRRIRVELSIDDGFSWINAGLYGADGKPITKLVRGPKPKV